MPQYTIKKCKKHGMTDYVLEPYRNTYRCRQCRIDAVTNNRRNRKIKLVKHFGGKCIICGYNRCPQALQFHHLNPEEKEFGISESGLCRSWQVMLEEAMKCILVCCRCHAEIENKVIDCPISSAARAVG
jgi:hypothetical protein